MQFRTMYTGHLSRVKAYMERAMSIINQYQFSTSGGPVIMLQLENEYGGTVFYTEHNGTQYYNYLYDIVRNSGFKEQLFTSDGSGWASNSRNKDAFKSNDVLQAVNLPRDLLKNFNLMRKSMPNKPTYASEYWTGWLDLWNSSVHQKGRTDFDKTVSEAVLEGNGSVNFYMFIGGTNFGFTNAAGIVTSYDYGAPLSESGNYTENYYKTRQIYQKLVSSGRLPKTHLPDVPPAPVACAYGKLPIQEKLSFEIVLEHAQKFSNLPKPVPMEMLNFTEKHNYGQRFGFILYRVEEKQVKEFKITGKIRDHAIFMVDQRPYGHIVDGANNFTFNFTDPPNETKTASHKYDLLVENLGRPNTFFEIWSDHWRKGILGGDIVLDDFNATFVRTLSSLKSEWQKFDPTNKSFSNSPSIYRAYLNVDKTPGDTYLLLPGWTKGIVLVNGFNIGRYWSVGPQKTLYIPGPLLKQGDNSIEVFELHQHGSELQFLDQPILE